jgi:hypothetical protein
MPRINTRRLSLRDAHPKDPMVMPYEYWTRVNQTTHLPNKMYFIMDEIYGPLIANYEGDGEWRGYHGPDPCQVTHVVAFEYPR